MQFHSGHRLTSTTADRVSERLKDAQVFVSASIPDHTREGIPPIDRYAAVDAIVTICSSILRQGGGLVIGGHPTISPLILFAAYEAQHEGALREGARVIVYQSELFRDEIPESTKELASASFATLVYTGRQPSREASLTFMRKRMIADHRFRGALFVGGLEGVREEFHLFRTIHPHRQVFCIGRPGGMARVLSQELGWKEHARTYPPGSAFNHDMSESDRFLLLATEIVSALARPAEDFDWPNHRDER